MRKYNPVGEWRPIVFEGDVNSILADIRSSTNDERVMGALFYIRTTNYNVIEFAVKGSLVLPHKEINLPNNVHLIPISEEDQEPTFPGREPSKYMYDGWIELLDTSVDSVTRAIQEIEWTLGLLGSSFGCRFEWVYKYQYVNHKPGDLMVTESHIDLLRAMLDVDHTMEDRIKIQSALDWYVSAKGMKNVFNRFLATWSALEHICSSLFSEDGFLSLKAELSQLKDKRITEKLADKNIPSDKKNFSTNDKIKVALMCIFKSDQEMKEIFTKKNTGGNTLANIRNMLSHGGIREGDADDLLQVRTANHVLERLVSNILIKITLNFKDVDDFFKEPRSMVITITTDDPRASMVCSDLRVLSAKSWRIKPDWIE